MNRRGHDESDSGEPGSNDKVYIHEFVDIRGHHRADYVHHMTANWSPGAQVDRDQSCFGVWSVLGTTGTWPQVVNMWEEDGWDGLAESFAGEAVGPGAQDRKLARWWAAAAEFRRGGRDRLMVPAPWNRTIAELCADGVRGVAYAHELVSVRPGAAHDLVESARSQAVPAHAEHGWEPVGAFTTAMVDDDEALLLWAIPTWSAWAADEKAHRDADSAVAVWRRSIRDVVTEWHRILLIDAPLAPMRTGRQPSVDDRTDWTD